MAIIYISAGNVLPILQVREAERPDTLKVEFLSQTLTLTGTVSVRESPIRINQSLSLGQIANFNPKKYSLTSTLTVGQVFTKAAITLLVNDYLAMNCTSRTVLAESVSNTLTLSSSIISSRSFTQQFEVTQNLTVALVRNLSPENEIELRCSVSVYKHQDDQFVGISIPAAVSPFLKVQLVCGSNNLELAVPEIGNANEIEHLRINRETRAGERIIYKDPMWPVLERFTYSFDNLNATQSANLLEFISRSLGQMITLTDHENIVWSVQLKNPDAEVEQTGRCSYSTELEFEGARV